MIYSILNRFPILLILLSCSAAYSQVYFLNAPLFAEAGQTVTIRAGADGLPNRVRLIWFSDKQDGQANMKKKTGSGYWTATIPAQAIQGTALSYTVAADYDQSPTETSPDGILYICPKYTPLKPQTMTLKKTVLTQKRWNSDDRAFGLLIPQEGPPTGPASIAYHKGNIYLLDSVKERVLRFNEAGRPRSITTVPTSMASDLVVDPTDDSLLVISQLEDKIYRLKKDGRLKHARSVPLRKGLVYPSKFTYDPSDSTLFAQDFAQQNGLVGVMHKDQNIAAAKRYVEKEPQVIPEAQGNKIVLGFNDNQQVIAITFDKPVACIEEAIADSNGIVWVLYTLRDDYRMRRLARVDIARNLVQVAEIDIWFAFHATRRMAITPKGIVLLAGDMEEAKIVAYDYNQ